MKMTMPTMMTADRVHYNLRPLHLCCTEGTSHAYFSQPDSDHQPCKDDDHHQPCKDDDYDHQPCKDEDDDHHQPCKNDDDQ